MELKNLFYQLIALHIMHSLCCGGIFLWLSGGSRAPSPFVTNLQNSVSKIPDLAQKNVFGKIFLLLHPLFGFGNSGSVTLCLSVSFNALAHNLAKGCLL